MMPTIMAITKMFDSAMPLIEIIPKIESTHIISSIATISLIGVGKMLTAHETISKIRTLHSVMGWLLIENNTTSGIYNPSMRT